jgi:hypothetical protein
MADNRIRKLSWLAPLALVAAGGLAACGDKDVTDTEAAASVEASSGSDQHLYNQAAEIEARSAVVGSDVHLYNQAAEIAESQAQPNVTETVATDAMPNAWEAGNRAAEAALEQG